MAKGFQYRKVSGFPKLEIGQIYSTEAQLSIEFPGLDNDDAVRSELKFLGESVHPDFYKFHVEHETVRPYRVRFNNQRRNNVILVEDFDLYVPKNFSYLWADTNTRNCTELLNRIKATELDRNGDFSFIEHEIDLVKLEKYIQPNITGGHFNKLNIVDVQAASIFGPGVGNSEDWKRYEDNGEISAIVFQLPFFGSLQRVMVTRNGGVVTYGALLEQDFLQLIEQVNDMVMKFVITPVN